MFKLINDCRFAALGILLALSLSHAASAQQQFRGVNLVGMEMDYAAYSQTNGPVAGTNYPVFDTRLIDYFVSKKVGAIRLLFSWEAMQPHLYDPIPNAAANTNYQAYFNNYKRVIDYATGKGLQVIIEPWDADSSGGAGGGRWRGNVIGSTQVPIAAFADFWNKMAAVYKNNALVSYGLINEPNNQSTTTWFQAAQAAITAIRSTGSTQRIFVPGNGWTGASDWTNNWYDTDRKQISNADGWLNANGTGKPLSDPLNNMAIEVHTFVDPEGSGGSTAIVSVTVARERIATTLNWATAHGIQVYLGQIGMYAGFQGNGFTAAAAWANFISYFNANPNSFLGYTWWAAGDPAWWPDPGAWHFSVSPTSRTTYTGDTVNMQMIQGDFNSNVAPPPVKYTLTVGVTGTGSVSETATNPPATPAQIANCTASNGTCSGNYASGTSVTLSATAGTGYVFAGWSG
ncbi:MAG: cellulase family glycosylhydrolase, partial [Rhodanobacter sp.]|nr:cellulase family glycosylhydrolase [Rhodanobacter sp.]